MPTRTTDNHPFAPRGRLTREQLSAYAEGRLAPDQAHEMELHREADALLDEALEGFEGTPGHGLEELDRVRPRVRGGGAWGLVTGGVLVLGLVGWALLHEEAATSQAEVVPSETEETQQRAVAPVITELEITEAVEQPESLLVGHEAGALHARTVAQEQVERERIERIESRSSGLEQETAQQAPRPSGHPRTSVQLIFLHDLKLVDPRELYTGHVVMRLADAGVKARFADELAQQRAGQEVLTMSYIEFMDAATDRFARNDHKGCLDDLRFVLNQYPDDVNALFYAGLCAYNLGLYNHARALLHRAATHPVDVFDEEATWYHALTLERLGEKDAAQEAFTRIARLGGFYAAGAEVRLEKQGASAR